MGSHALLSPSSASRWTVCTQSARMEEPYPSKDTFYTAEGTLCHAIGELMLRQFTGTVDADQFYTILDILKQTEFEGKKLYNEEMYEYARDYADFVIAQCFGDYYLLIEAKLDMTSYVPEGFGTGDSLVLKDRKLIFNDLKYGKGVRVSAVQNKQMMLYAIGALNDYGFMYEVEEIEMDIFQPRIDNISSFTITVKELLEWAETDLREQAKLAFAGEGEFVPGDHCTFCKAKNTCKALADFNINLAKIEFMDADLHLLTDEEVVNIIKNKLQIEKWLKGISDYALTKALEGKKWEGLKVVEGKSNRVYTNETEVADTLVNNLITNIYTEPQLLGITALKKNIGAHEFEQYVEPLLYKPPGKPTLVPSEDKRPEFASAELDFKDLLETDIDN